MPLEHRGKLVCDVVDQRVGAVSVLLDAGHEDPGQGRDVVGPPGHPQVLASQVDVEGHPHRGADYRRHRQAGRRSGCDRLGRADVETEPVPDVVLRGCPQLRFCALGRLRTVEIDIDSGPDAQIPCQQRGRPFDDPLVISQVQALQQPVVGDLALELRQRPPAAGGEGLKPVGQGAPERRRGGITGRLVHRATRVPLDRAGSRSRCALASSSQRGVPGSPTRSSSQRMTPRPSPRRRPNRDA